MGATAGSRRFGSCDLGFDDREIDIGIEDVVDEVRQHELCAECDDFGTIFCKRFKNVAPFFNRFDAQLTFSVLTMSK